MLLPFDTVPCEIHIIEIQAQRGSRCQKQEFVEIIKLSTSDGFGEHTVVLKEGKKEVKIKFVSCKKKKKKILK